MKRNLLRCASALVSALLLAPLLFHVAALADGEAAQELTGQCTFLAPSEKDRVKKLTDGSVRSYHSVKAGKAFEIALPEGAHSLYLQWYEVPAAFTLSQTDESGALLQAERFASPVIDRAYALSEHARGVVITSEEALSLAELRVYGAGTLPADVHAWQPPVGKADLLVVSAHCDDELLYFGGTIPTYAGQEGLAVQVAYMAHGNRLRQFEAMNGLWLSGVKNAPVFLGFRDRYSETLQDASRAWGYDATVAALASLIRRFQPEVVVTHDLEGEYGHGAHRLTAAAMLDAVKLAAGTDEILGCTYAPWQTKKLYLHLYQENRITMDWRKPLSAFDGKTALEMANLAYLCHESQLEYHTAVHDDGDYSCAEFGLAYTAVGPDVSGGDFFEHIDPSLLTNYVAPTPAPTAAPTAAPTSVPSDVPVLTPAPSAVVEETPVRPNLGPLLIPAAIVLAAAALAATVYLATRRKKK